MRGNIIIKQLLVQICNLLLQAGASDREYCLGFFGGRQKQTEMKMQMWGNSFSGRRD